MTSVRLLTVLCLDCLASVDSASPPFIADVAVDGVLDLTGDGDEAAAKKMLPPAKYSFTAWKAKQKAGRNRSNKRFRSAGGTAKDGGQKVKQRSCNQRTSGRSRVNATELMKDVPDLF